MIQGIDPIYGACAFGAVLWFGATGSPWALFEFVLLVALAMGLLW